MAMFWAFVIVVALHIAVFIGLNLKDSPREQPPQTLIEVSLITKSMPIKAKQNEAVIAENQPPVVEVVPQPPRPEPVKPIPKPIEKPITKPVVPVKKEPPKPLMGLLIIVKVAALSPNEPVGAKVISPPDSTIIGLFTSPNNCGILPFKTV